MAGYVGTIKGIRVIYVEDIEELKRKQLEENTMYLVHSNNWIIRDNHIIGEYNPKTRNIDLYIHPEYIDLTPTCRTLTKQIAQETRKENDWVEPLDLDSYLRRALITDEVGGIKLGI